MKVKDLSYIFSPGDYVEVADGELVNLRGKVQSVDGEKIVMLPDHEDLKVFSFLFSKKSVSEAIKLSSCLIVFCVEDQFTKQIKKTLIM